MSLIQQITLLAAGAQPWYIDVCSAHQDKFAYAATQAIYIYSFDANYSEFKLSSILSEHKKPISSIKWHPNDSEILASSSIDNVLIVWNITHCSVIAFLKTSKSPPTLLGWCLHDKEVISYINDCGPLYTWRYSSNSNQPSSIKEISTFSNAVTLFRWHPKKTGKVVFGHLNGTLSVYTSGTKLIRQATINNVNPSDDNPIVALEWDPLSVDYVLLAHNKSGMKLIDTNNMNVITVFSPPSTANVIKTLGWISEAPGMLISGDADTGILRLWNASNSTPLENIKLKANGFHILYPVTTKAASSKSNKLQHQHSLMKLKCHLIPKVHIVCLFVDGGIGLYNLAQRKWDFIREMGHIETIFDCKFKPDTPDILATGSFDGTIKVWNISSMTPIQSSVGNESIIYCISWAPADLDCIAAATSKNGVIIWHLKKGTVIRKFAQHNDECVYSVAWNQKDARCIASGGGDHNCVIHHADGTIVNTFPHPGIVFGLDWMPNDSNILATACEDGVIRVFNISGALTTPEKTFIGHTAKAFHVRWNPLKNDVFCSGSDDGSIRIWDYNSESCINVLHGHTSNVRGIVWSPEVPYLLFSGSWDCTIRAWDARDGGCLDSVFDHGADVYGLSIHPHKPFVLVSSSRDSTLRVWSVLPLTPLLPIYIFTQQPWSDIIAFSDRGFKLGVRSLLCGRRSMEIQAECKNDPNPFLKTIQEFSLLFTHSWGTTNLWDLVKIIKGCEISELSPNYTKGIIHSKHIVKIKTSEAEELQMNPTTRFGHGGIGVLSREECLQMAAEIYLHVGNVQKYCQLLAELGKWDQALAVAPAVSWEFWKELASKRLQVLIQEENEESLTYGIATGNLTNVFDFLIKNKQTQQAYMLAVAAKEKMTISAKNNSSNSEIVHEQNEQFKNRFLQETISLMAEQNIYNGSPIYAACYYLASDNVKDALLCLIRGFELELAVSVGLTLEEKTVTRIALQYLAKRCECLGQWELAVKMLQLIPGNGSAAWMVCARCATSLSEQESLYKLAGLPRKDDCLKIAEECYSKGNVREAVKYYLLTVTPEKGLILGLETIRKEITAFDWDMKKTWDLLQYLGCIRRDKLHESKYEKDMIELLVFSSYVGALMAIRRNYYPVVGMLLMHSYLLLGQMDLDFPLSQDLVQKELNAWNQFLQADIGSDHCKNSPNTGIRVTGDSYETYENLLKKSGKETEPIDLGPTVITGSHLPTHSDTHICFLTQERIQGPAFFLEDGHSAISHNNALMWAKVNPFSPLGNGLHINPF